MKLPNDRLLLHLARDRRRAVDPEDIYFLEATGQTTLVRLRSSRRLRDTRTLGDLVPLLSPFGVVLDVRRRGGEADWEVKLEPPVNRVLPVSRMYLKELWAAFGES
jgi:hypothetical protein